MNLCHCCRKPTSNPKYCSRSCSGIINGKAFPKRRRRIYTCFVCNQETRYRRKYCSACFNSGHNPNYADWSRITLRDTVNRRKFQVYSRIRTLARKIYFRSTRKQGCAYCGYSRHFEVHHIKSIQSFNLDATIMEINAITNLIGLCPNHHWEADNGILTQASLLRHRQ